MVVTTFIVMIKTSVRLSARVSLAEVNNKKSKGGTGSERGSV